MFDIFIFLRLSLSLRFPSSLSFSLCLPSFALYHSERRRTIHKGQQEYKQREGRVNPSVAEGQPEPGNIDSNKDTKKERRILKERARERERVSVRDKNRRRCRKQPTVLCAQSLFTPGSFVLSHGLSGNKPRRACGGRQKTSVFLLHLPCRLSSALVSLILLPGGR